MDRIISQGLWCLMIHFYPFNYWLLAAQDPRPRLRVWPLTYIKRCTLIQLWDMQRSRTRFPRHRHDNNLIVSGPRPYLAQIVWRLWIRITAGHSVLAEFHKSSYKGNIQEFSRLICMRGYLSAVSQNSPRWRGWSVRNFRGFLNIISCCCWSDEGRMPRSIMIMFSATEKTGGKHRH